MKLIEVNKAVGETGRFNLHYINPNHIIEVFEWMNQTVIRLRDVGEIRCINTLSDILNKISQVEK